MSSRRHDGSSHLMPPPRDNSTTFAEGAPQCGGRYSPDDGGQPVTRSLPLLPTSLVGSWPQPSWLVDRARLDAHLPVRVSATDLWLVDGEHLAEAQRDAVALAVHEQERVGLDIITDGEVRRESYSNRFATALDGIDLDR